MGAAAVGSVAAAEAAAEAAAGPADFGVGCLALHSVSTRQGIAHV